MNVSLDISFVNVYLFYVDEDNSSGILKQIFESNKHLNTMQNHWVVQMRLHFLAIFLLSNTASFIKDPAVFFVGKGSHWTTKMRLVVQLELMGSL